MNEQTQAGESTEPSGVLVVNKHSGATSHDIVNKIRRLYGTRRVGHTGTLDPMATGVLVILVGRAAKAAEFLVCDVKHYTARLRLGMTTDSEDTTGNVLTRSDRIPAFAELEAVLPAFRGKIQQIPPMYSALKINGQKLVDLARRGQTVERQPREIEIFSLSAAPTEIVNDFQLEVCCSSGTYIRTLCADIGATLGCGGVMAALERTGTGGFFIGEATSIAELESMDTGERIARLIPTESLFRTLQEIRLPAFFERLCRGGCEIYLQKLGLSLPVDTRVRLCSEDGKFFAVGEVGDYEEGAAVKSIKTFVL